jgi:hypothetical protein
MFRVTACCALALLVSVSWAAAPKKKKEVAPAQSAAPVADRSMNVYQYYTNSAKDVVLVQSQVTLSNPDADARALRNLREVVSELDKRGFQKSANAVVSDWDKPDPFVKCYIYLEDAEAGRKSATGARVWCARSGISELEVQPSTDPKHAEKVLVDFDRTFKLAKEKK